MRQYLKNERERTNVYIYIHVDYGVIDKDEVKEALLDIKKVHIGCSRCHMDLDTFFRHCKMSRVKAFDWTDILLNIRDISDSLDVHGTVAVYCYDFVHEDVWTIRGVIMDYDIAGVVDFVLINL